MLIFQVALGEIIIWKEFAFKHAHIKYLSSHYDHCELISWPILYFWTQLAAAGVHSLNNVS